MPPAQLDAVFRSAAAHASATSRFGSSLPGTVAQPVFVTKSRWSYDDDSALSSTIFFFTAPSAFDLAMQMGTSAVVTAVSACTFARRAVVPLVVQPPKLNPMIIVTTLPATAPHRTGLIHTGICGIGVLLFRFQRREQCAFCAGIRSGGR